MQTFESLGVPAGIVDALKAQGITSPFPIQALSLADGLAGRDVTGKAQTGSGKTLAFGIPMLVRAGAGSPRLPAGLVLAPTRELAAQITTELGPLAVAVGARVAVVHGGTPMEPQIKALQRGVDVLVATPGRLIDLMRRGAVGLEGVRVVAIDEADRMADLGFLPPVEWLLRHIPVGVQTMLFSATLDGAVARLTRRMVDPSVHAVDDASPTVEAMTHRFLQVHYMDKPKVVARLAESNGRTLVFCRTKRACDKVSRALLDLGCERRPSTVISRSPNASGRWLSSPMAPGPCSSPPTWRHGASTSTPSMPSSTTTRPRTPRPTCTAPGVPPAPAPPGWSCAWSSGTRSSMSAASSVTSASATSRSCPCSPTTSASTTWPAGIRSSRSRKQPTGVVTPVGGRSQQADGDADMAPEDLFMVPPEDFVAARNSVVKALKAAGDREQAALVAAWRRPSIVDWALNVVASEHADVVKEFVEAAAAGRSAQSAAVSGRGGDDLRTAIGELRDAIGRVVRRADEVAVRSGKARGALTATVTSRLTEVAATPDLAEQLVQHRLGSGEVEVDDVFAGPSSGPSTTTKERTDRPTKAGRPSKAARATKAPRTTRAAPAPPPVDPAARRELARAVAAAERAESAAQTAADRTAARVQRATADLAQAQDRLTQAEEAHASAEEEHAKATGLAEEAARAAEEARTRLAREKA